MFWKKKKPEKENESRDNYGDDRYQELYRKVSDMVVKVDDLDHRLSLVDSICKSNRSRINHLKIDKQVEEAESNLKSDGEVFLGANGRMRP
jgi:hypothetical protein